MSEQVQAQTEQTKAVVQETNEQSATKQETAVASNAAPSVSQETANLMAAEAAKADVKGDKAVEEKKVVPEKYELKLPENSLLDQSHVEDVAAYAKENGLSQEQAQKILEREAETVSDYQQTLREKMDEASQLWKQQVVEDKELGGQNFNKNVELAHRALSEFGSEKLKEMLEKTGFGNHPEIVRLFSKIGAARAEGTFINPKANSGSTKTMEDVFYGGKN